MGKHYCGGIEFPSLKLATMHANRVHAQTGVILGIEAAPKPVPMRDEDFAAMAEYAATYGRGWKDRLTNAWLNDWREQWGILRSVRNDPYYHQGEGLVGIFKTYEADKKRRNAGK